MSPDRLNHLAADFQEWLDRERREFDNRLAVDDVAEGRLSLGLGAGTSTGDATVLQLPPSSTSRRS